MSQDKNCLFCGRPLPPGHGNRRYCEDDSCSYLQKQNRGSQKYWDQKEQLERFADADNLLADFYKTYGSDVHIPSDIFIKAGMDWSIVKEEITIDGFPVKVIGNYGYCLFTNETLRIWKIKA